MPKLIDHDERRAHIAEATWRVVVRDGVAAASVRAVAAEAGLSPGSLRHVFASQSELLVYALHLVVDRAAARVGALSDGPTAAATVRAVAAELLPLDRERRAEMEVYLALFDAANTDPALQAPRAAAYQHMRDACWWMIEHLDNGVDLASDAEVEVEAARLHVLLDGLAAHLVWAPADAEVGWAHDVLLRHLASLRPLPMQ